LIQGKEFPNTKYTGKNFDTSIGDASSLYLQRGPSSTTTSSTTTSTTDDNDETTTENEKCDHVTNDCTQCSRGSGSQSDNQKDDIQSTNNDNSNDNDNDNDNNDNEDDEDDDEDDEDLHLPAGQHLLVDIKNVDSNFLDSEKELAQAMVDVVNESALTLLSYHCHHLQPTGVSCVGVLLESHISFHTWPEEGVITLDLFTCGSGLLIPVLPLIKKLFAIPDRSLSNGETSSTSSTVTSTTTTSTTTPLAPEVKWSHKLRGFRPDGIRNPLSDDLGKDVETLNSEQRTRITTVQTKFQSIDIYDIQSDPDDEQVNRLVYLDGILQSTRDGNEAYHEALVQPAMFAHSNPKRVAIIGGGEGATLREVLKHESIEKVKMIEIDGEMVDVSHTYLPDWNDCSDIVGSAAWCGDDDRADLHYEDAFAWFIERFSEEGKIDQEEYKEEKFDVVIMDALDPQDDVPFADFLYTNDNFFKTLHDSLTESGILVLQLGMSPDSFDPSEDFSKNHKRAYLIGALSRIGFESIHVYEEAHCGFAAPWSFLVAMKDYSSRALWYRNSAEVNLEIHKRMLKTHSMKPSLKHFDGSIMREYQVPHKAFEIVYCKKDPTPYSCVYGTKSSSPKSKDVSMSQLSVKMSNAGKGSGRGLFTNVDIEAGSSIGKRDRTKSVYFAPSAVSLLLYVNYYMDDEADDVYSYMDGYGWESTVKGTTEYYVDSTILTFANHGCNGTINIASKDYNETESTPVIYDPYYDRHTRHSVNDQEYATRLIATGEEILCDYSDLAEGDNAEDFQKSIDRMCKQEEVGDITKWESEE